MISKELLSEVFNKEVINIIDNPKDDLTLGQNEIVVVFDGYKQKWNIFELAHKCKEWAFTNGYELRNGRDIDVKEDLCYFCEYKQERQLDYISNHYFLADTEYEAIFKVCQWILEGGNKK